MQIFLASLEMIVASATHIAMELLVFIS